MLPLLDGQSHLKFTFKEKSEIFIDGSEKISVLDLSSSLYDLTLLYDCIALAAIPEYREYNFHRFFWFRNGRPVKDEHRLYLEKINQNSPLSLEVIIPLAASSFGVPWLIIQAAEKIKNWGLNRKKLELEVEKLELENDQKRLANLEKKIQLDSILTERGALQTFNRVIARLENDKLIATDLEVITKSNTDDGQNEDQRST
jgi:hypothetical protein